MGWVVVWLLLLIVVMFGYSFILKDKYFVLGQVSGYLKNGGTVVEDKGLLRLISDKGYDYTVIMSEGLVDFVRKEGYTVEVLTHDEEEDHETK